MTYGYLSGVIQLDTAIEFNIKSEAENGITLSEWWSLRNLLKKVVHKEKPLFQAIASLEGGAVMAIICTWNGWDEELTNITTSTVAWAMYNLLLEHNATGKSIKAATTAWFLTIHKTASITY